MQWVALKEQYRWLMVPIFGVIPTAMNFYAIVLHLAVCSSSLSIKKEDISCPTAIWVAPKTGDVKFPSRVTFRAFVLDLAEAVEVSLYSPFVAPMQHAVL